MPGQMVLVYGPYGGPSSTFINVTEAAKPSQNTNRIGYESNIGDISALLPHPNGIWMVGTGWLYSNIGETFYFPDVPQYGLSTDILVDKDNLLWLHSFKTATWNLGAFQMVNDNGTAILEDDGWQSSWDFSIQAAEVDGLELAPNGDLWIGGYSRSRFPRPTLRASIAGIKGSGLITPKQWKVAKFVSPTSMCRMKTSSGLPIKSLQKFFAPADQGCASPERPWHSSRSHR